MNEKDIKRYICKYFAGKKTGRAKTSANNGRCKTEYMPFVFDLVHCFTFYELLNMRMLNIESLLLPTVYVQT